MIRNFYSASPVSARHKDKSKEIFFDALFDDEFFFDEADIAKAIAVEKPEWAGLPLTRIGAGTDNRMYRMGYDFTLRVPRTPGASVQLRKEATWMPRVTRHLPLGSPQVIHYAPPRHPRASAWAVYGWIPGTPGADQPGTDSRANAIRLAEWISALRSVDPAGGPAPGPHSFGRGENLARRYNRIAALLAKHRLRFDAKAGMRLWDLAIEASGDGVRPGWLHGDLQPSNLLTRDGAIHAVIDFGGLAVGDTACDLLACWTTFSASNRAVLRDCLQTSDAEWKRGRGWALATAIEAFDFYWSSRHPIMRQAERTLAAVFEQQL